MRVIIMDVHTQLNNVDDATSVSPSTSDTISQSASVSYVIGKIASSNLGDSA